MFRIDSIALLDDEKKTGTVAPPQEKTIEEDDSHDEVIDIRHEEGVNMTLSDEAKPKQSFLGYLQNSITSTLQRQSKLDKESISNEEKQSARQLLRRRTSHFELTDTVVQADGMYSLAITPGIRDSAKLTQSARRNSGSRLSETSTREQANHPATFIPSTTFDDGKFWTFKGRKIPITAYATQHVTLPEHHRYTFAIILRSAQETRKALKKSRPFLLERFTNQEFLQLVLKTQRKCLNRLISSGLGVVVLNNEEAKGSICLLIDPHKDKNLLIREFRREKDEIAMKTGTATARLGLTALDDVKKVRFSAALELQLTHNIIRNAFKDYDREEWMHYDDELSIWDIVRECFPLHDRSFNKHFFQAYTKNTFDFSMAKATRGNSERWAIEELRLHFGERVAFLFAFMHIYNKFLLPVMMLSVTYYLSFRFIPAPIWSHYMRGLSLIGFGIATIWAPAFLLFWERETKLLVEKWNLKSVQNTAFEQNDDNPNFKYVWKKNPVTGEMEKAPPHTKRRLLRYVMLIFVFVSAILQCLFLVPFIQWYVFAKTAPDCAACEESFDPSKPYRCIQFWSCFASADSLVGTDRWFYILVQGILLGLTIDILFWNIFNWLSEKFVNLENYESKTEFENRLIHRRFLFVWTNWFFWFLFIAFVYLPYGQFINRTFGEVFGLGWFIELKWEPDVLTLDTLFVTPLVVTQALNLLLETIVPYLFKQYQNSKHSCCRSTCCDGKIGFDNSLVQGPDLDVHMLAFDVSNTSHHTVPVLDRGDDVNQISAAQVIQESKLTIFDPMNDFLDACIQFSYVVMFSIIWPLLPFPAFVNNLFEVRGDAFRLLYASRRPMPRRDNSIGEWTTVLSYANAIGVIVVSGFIFLYHFGFWITECNSKFSDGAFIPFSSIRKFIRKDDDNCEFDVESSAVLIYFILLEHLGLAIRYLVSQGEKTPSSIGTRMYRRLQHVKELSQRHSISAAQFEFIRDLRQVFDEFDEERDSHLNQRQLLRFLARWFDQPLESLERVGDSIMRYMDKNNMGRVSFVDCALLLRNIVDDRLLCTFLGLDPYMSGVRSELLRLSEDASAIQWQIDDERKKK